mmetsp:Transcript_16687/g.18068  ORF Transcript_16687/g.18068 Transcript_16687/m.18068 type:complete len:257 (+) Transcript_16687:105-875(+)
MMEGEQPMENWKQFQGTELGGLLGQIYGSQSRVKINYPKPRSNSSQNLHQEKKDFIPGGAKIDAVDPRKTTRRSVNVNVPKPTGRVSSNDEDLSIGYKAIDFVPKRKSADVIKQEIDDIRMRQERYRPAHVKPIHSEMEKDRLTQIFTFKGGKGLPEELTHPVGETPMEAMQRNKERDRIDAIRQKRGLLVVKQRSDPVLSVNEQIAQQISSEIEERTRYLDDMKKVGLNGEKERQIKQEIAFKVKELERIDKENS